MAANYRKNNFVSSSGTKSSVNSSALNNDSKFKSKNSNTKDANQFENRRPKLKKASSVNADILGPRLVFIIATLALLLFGFVMVFSASSAEATNNGQSPYSYLGKQIAIGAGGIALAIVIWRFIPFSFWKGKAIWVCIGLLLLFMLATAVIGTERLGAKRWIEVGGTTLQASEFAKILMVLVTAKLYFDFHTFKISIGKFLLLAGLTDGLILCFMLIGQSDLGTTIISVVGLICVFYFSGAPLRLIGALFIGVVALGLVAIVFQPYRLDRLLVLFNPYDDGQGGFGDGYQYIRARYALSSGGLFGMGLGNSYEKYQYLPEAENDYIYAVICEELGLIGGIVVAILFVVLLISGLLIARASRSSYGACISGSFTVMLIFQAFLNIFCVVGLIPTTGKTLPFVSYGGSSLLASLMMVGFILAASEDSSTMDVYERRRSLFAVISENITTKVGVIGSRDTDHVQAEINITQKNRDARNNQEIKDRVNSQYYGGKRNNVARPKFNSGTGLGQDKRSRLGSSGSTQPSIRLARTTFKNSNSNISSKSNANSTTSKNRYKVRKRK